MDANLSTIYPSFNSITEATPTMLKYFPATPAIALMAPSANEILIIAHAGPPTVPWDMTPFKGMLGETLMDRVFTQRLLFDTGDWVSLSPARIGMGGIDGLYVHTDRFGNPREILVAEAKFNSSRLRMTRDGKQMGSLWIQKRLDLTSKDYMHLAERLSGEPIQRASRVPNGVITKRIAIKENGFAEVWKTSKGYSYFSNDSTLTSYELKVQARRMARILMGGADGKIRVRRTIFRYKLDKSNHSFSIEHIDPVTGKSLGKLIINKPFQKLHKIHQKLIRQKYEQTFRNIGKSYEESRKLAKKVCEDPEYARIMRKTAIWSWRTGLDYRVILAGMAAGGIAFLSDLVIQALQRGKIDLSNSARIAGVTGVSSAMMYYGTVQVQSFMITTNIGQGLLKSMPLSSVSKALSASWIGSMGVGLFAVAIFTYGGLIFGYSDLETANRNMFSGGAGIITTFGVYTGTFSAVATFGTASTGTAIGSLSGAAANSATLAWIGGITGGGMAAGAIILTGGAIAAGIITSIGMNFIFSILDEKSKRAMVAGRLEFVSKRVLVGA